jgi:3-hydroxyisobutyrate dehydrogenase
VNRVAFIGLGAMGLPMVDRLVHGGVDVVGFDVSDEARRRCVELGAGVVDSAAAAVRFGDAVILMLPNSDVVESVVCDSAVAEHIAGRLVIDMSSSEPLRTRALAEDLANRGASFIDAPVSGGVRGARAGTLTVMVGGPSNVAEGARVLLENFGRVVAVGAVGAGHALKAFNNLLSATHLLITGEVMVAGERFGLDPRIMLEVFNSSSGKSGSTENKWPNFVLPGTFNSGFALALMLKDMRIARALAAAQGTPIGLGDKAVEIWSRAAQELPPTADHTEIANWLEEGGETS